ncbi:MAG: glycosyltransferase family 4 protein [Candidatus Hadarchaeum sp.]
MPVVANSHRRYRICHIAYTFVESDTRVARYGLACAEAGHEVEFIALRQNSQCVKGLVSGLRVFRIQHRSPNEKGQLKHLLRTVIFSFTAMLVISFRFLKTRYNLVHVHNMPDFLVFACWLPKLAGAKIILDIHDLVPELYVDKFGRRRKSWVYRCLLLLERISCSFADHVIVSNPLWAERISKRAANPRRCTCLINYPDTTIFKPSEQPIKNRADGKFLIIYPGSLNWHQGLHIAIEAMTHLVSRIPGVELHIYGDGPALPRLKSMTRELQLDGKVVFHRPVDTEQIAQIMAEADLGVIPKLADGFGNEAFSTKSLEFMACGIPVVMSKTLIDTLYFTDDQVKFFESGNPEALAEAIWEVYSKPDETRRRVQAAIDLVSKENWEVKKTEYLGLVETLLRPKDKEPSKPKG